MYGFLRPYYPILTREERAAYQKIYCGQCAALGSLFGYPWRLLVSYDASFLALLLSSQQNHLAQKEKVWCGILPRRVTALNADDVPQLLSSCFSMVIFSARVIDSRLEKRSFINAALGKLASKNHEKARSILKSLGFPVEALDFALRSQDDLERGAKHDIIRYAEPTARFSAEAFRFVANLSGARENEDVLYSIGYNVGMTIYLSDACFDIIKDMQKGQFNPLLMYSGYGHHFDHIDSREEVANFIVESMTRIDRLTDELVLRNYHKLLKNILCAGFPSTVRRRVGRTYSKLRKAHQGSLKYLPHAAILTGICLSTIAEASSGSREIPYDCGIKCFNFTGDFPICDMCCNPCYCYYSYEKDVLLHDRGDLNVCACIGQLPKYILTAAGGYFAFNASNNYIQEGASRRYKKAQEEERKDKIKKEAYLENVLKEFIDIESDIHKLSKNLNISFPVDYRAKIKTSVLDQKYENLANSRELGRIIKEQRGMAIADIKNLEIANQRYQNTMKLYSEIENEVIKTGSKILIDKMENIKNGLTSNNFKDLLLNKQWIDFEEEVKTFIEVLERIRKSTIGYQNEGYEKKTEKKEKETEEEKAYRILGLPPTASSDEIQKVFKALIKPWHSDRSKGDDERTKELIWAREFLIKIKK